MTAQDAWSLGNLLSDNFEEIADVYADAVANGGGLEDVINYLDTVAAGQ